MPAIANLEALVSNRNDWSRLKCASMSAVTKALLSVANACLALLVITKRVKNLSALALKRRLLKGLEMIKNRE